MRLRSVVFVLLFAVFSLSPSYTQGASKNLNIVAGTELIADITRDLLGDGVQILTLISASSCPGHYDVRATDIAFMSRADVIIIHEWQGKQKPVADAVKAAGNLAALFFAGPMPSWLIPENQIQASRNLAVLFSGMPGINAKRVEDRLAQRIERIAEAVAVCEKDLGPFAGSPVMVSDMQAGFVRRFGMNVIADYGRAEDISPGGLMRLSVAGKKAGALVVVDNMQSGAEAGLPLAGEIGAAYIAFSHFPRFVQEVPDYETLLRYNCGLLTAALKGKAGKP
ncbi:MAG: zinc ABC transporter substrate-binding protein [Syntrophorhabdaceae bacterium]|nr:zinc ABC transporter substrate-binding protein [Syntrophorhabdaceae bacterium]